MTGQPLVLTDALETLGAPAWATVVASTGLALYHLREVLVILSRVAAIAKVAAVVLGLLIVASTGLVPGVELQLEPFVLVEWVVSLGRFGWGVLRDLLRIG